MKILVWLATLALLLPSDGVSKTYRDPAQRAAFKKSHPCPLNGKASGPCPGYVVDHVRPLACGGADSPVNMQWQTTVVAKAKDKVERLGCQRSPGFSLGVPR